MKAYFYSLSTRNKLSLIITSLSFCSLMLFSVAKVYLDYRSQRAALKDSLATTSAIIGDNLKAPLLFQDAMAATEVLNTLNQDAYITRATLWNHSGEAFAEYVGNTRCQDLWVTQCGLIDHRKSIGVHQMEVVADGETLGVLVIERSLAPFYEEILVTALISGALALLATFLAWLGATFLQSLITRRISMLRQAVEDVEQSKVFHHRIEDDGHTDDIGVLISGFNRMMSEIEERDDSLEEARKVLELKVEERTSELAQAMEKAEGANRAKSAFLATMSHEMRTPLNAVIGNSELMLQKELDAQDAEGLETIQQSGNALLSLINDILDFSKIEAERLELEERDFELLEAITQPLALQGTRAVANRVRLCYALDSELPTAVVGDETRLRQVITNLISNAIKFSPDGEVLLRVSSEADAELAAHRLTIKVEDNGVGIPSDKLETIFDPFTQADGSTTRKYGGTGLGLTICRRIVEAMGGTLQVQSRVALGTTFTLKLELKEAPASPAPYHHNARNFMGKRILVIEPHEPTRKLLEQLQRSWGALCDAVGTAYEGFCLLEEKTQYQAVIIGMKPDTMSVEDLAAQIRKIPRQESLPLLLLSDVPRLPTEYADGLIQAVVTFPCAPSQLFMRLADMLGMRTGGNRSHGLGKSSNGKLGESHPLSILIAEDNLVNQKVMQKILASMAYDCDIAANGEIALEMLREKPYDLVLMDMQMPIMDGLEASRHIIREYSDDRRPRIVALTANALKNDQDACRDAGMDGFVSKPVQLALLREILKETPSLTTKMRADASSKGPAKDSTHLAAC
ncbi:MAG: ATP-binding protein [Opitutales bacterium]